MLFKSIFTKTEAIEKLGKSYTICSLLARTGVPPSSVLMNLIGYHKNKMVSVFMNKHLLYIKRRLNPKFDPNGFG